MWRNSTQADAIEVSGRDRRLMLVLLAVAVVIAIGYALTTIVDFGRLPRPQFDSGLMPLVGLAGIAVLIGALVVAHGLRPGERKPITAAVVRDALLDMHGREKLLRTLSGEIDNHAAAERQLALHVVDIDRFARLNAMLGEAEGDALLRGVAERLLVLAGENARVARIGDDEFAVIQPETGGARHAEIYANRIQDALKDACAQVARQARPGASIGIAVYPDHGESARELLHGASLAMRAAKRTGGGFRTYAPDMETAADDRLQMEQVVADGLHEGRFSVHFQPLYDLRTSRLMGFEALARMQHPEHGELLPEDFLPAAEESGLIQPLGEWIIRDALAQAALWPPHLKLALNVSTVEFRHGDVAAMLLNALQTSGFEAARLQVEISEAALHEPGVPVQLLRLKANEVTLVLDDFGIGGSRLPLLAQTPCDAVKLDRSLVERIGDGPEPASFVKSLIGTARAFDLDVLAEGVERPEQAAFLMTNDCHKVQGNLFGRPAPATEVAAIVARDMRAATADKAPTRAAAIEAA